MLSYQLDLHEIKYFSFLEMGPYVFMLPVYRDLKLVSKSVANAPFELFQHGPLVLRN